MLRFFSAQRSRRVRFYTLIGHELTSGGGTFRNRRLETGYFGNASLRFYARKLVLGGASEAVPKCPVS